MIDRSISRRRFIQATGAATATALLAPRRGSAAWKPIPVGTQLWCVKDQLAEDIPGTLAALGKAGYEGVELENAFERPGGEWRRYLDDAGLRACGFHHHLADLKGDALEKTVAFNQEIGNRNLIVRWLPEEVHTSAELLKQTAEAFNEIAERTKPHGMRVGYHNHTADFHRIDGEFWWNLFADATSKDVVLQLDTGNAALIEGGVPMVDILRRNAGRTVTIHVKPFSKKDPAAYLGEDELDWNGIMTACEEVGGTEWYIIEYEVEGTPPLDALAANLDNFEKLRS